MRAWGFVCVLALAACYRGASELPNCTLRCSEGCPDGTSCVGGYCSTGGASCGGQDDAGVDASAACGGIGEACCASGPQCESNGYCVQGTCHGDCITDVSLGKRHGCAIRHDSTVWCSGYNNDGEVGVDSSVTAQTSTFTQVSDATGPITDATAIGAGDWHTCAVRAGGAVWCWGYGGYGERGDNTYNTGPVATEVVTAGGPLTGIVEVDSGSAFACARDGAGGVWCWGYNGHGELGDNTLNSRPYAAAVLDATGTTPFTGATALATEHDQACVIQNGNHVWCWGRNDYGQLGDGTTSDRYVPVQTTDATAVALAGYSGCALLSDSTVKCWGGAWQDRLGNGSTNNQPTPAAVTMADGTPLANVAALAGGGLACAVTTDHRALCWGTNTHGQVGNGGGARHPTAIATGPVDRIYAHYAHACAHGVDGSMTCWGRNTEGELGNGTFENVGSPQPVAALCSR